MADDVSVTISGLPDLRAALRSIPDKLRRKALRQALAAGARVVLARIRTATPVLDLANPDNARAAVRGRRKPGTVRKALAVRTSKAARRAGDVGVFVNVRPAKGAKRGARNPSDPYYWRWINFGWTPAGGDRSKAGKRRRRAVVRAGATPRRPGAHFLEAGAAALREALNRFIAEIGPRIARLNGGPNAQP